MTVVSTCHISFGRAVRRPTFGLAGCTRSRGRRQPNFRTKLYHVEGDAQTLPSRCASTASVPVGTWRYSIAVTMSLIVRISVGVSRWGDVCGQDDCRRAHRRAEAGARRETDLRTIPGAAGASATAQTHGRDR